MFRAYLAIGALILATLGYAQREYWSIFGSDAERNPRGSFAAGPRHK